jgi:hypothetical protein
MVLLGQKLDKVVMILSTGRTGTMAVAEYFNKGFNGIRAVHEPRPSWRLRIAAHKYMAGQISREQAIRAFVQAREQQIARTQQPIYAESNPFLVGLLDIMNEVFDRPKIVHIVRDPRTMVRSALNFGAHRGLKRWTAELLPYWVIRPEQMEANPRQRWQEMTPLEIRAWMWGMKNEWLEKGAELYGKDYLRVRFEDIFGQNSNGLRKIADWIGVEEKPGMVDKLLTKKVNASRPTRMPTWDQWTDTDRQQLMQYCGKLMAEYGYLEGEVKKT